MRILHLIGSLSREIGGPTEACLQMARAVAARGHQVAIFTTNWTIGGVEPVPVGVPLQQDGITITYAPEPGRDADPGTPPVPQRARRPDVSTLWNALYRVSPWHARSLHPGSSPWS